MNWFARIRNIKFLLVFLAVCLAIISLLTSNYLITDLKQEECNDVEIWSEAMRSLNTADENTDLNLVLKVINGNNKIPVIVLSSNGDIVSHRNIDEELRLTTDSVRIIKDISQKMISSGHVIRIDIPVEKSDSIEEYDYLNICYDESLMLRRLEVYPFVQLAVVILFVMVAIFAFFAASRAEQNKVWVGLSKETAHQLGTPISSLMAWSAVLKESYPDDALIPEMDNDIKRLERVADRFSKIGSMPEPKPEDIVPILNNVVLYMKHRISSKVNVTYMLPEEPVIVNLVSSLFEWVIENLMKNAVDAIDGAGSIKLMATVDENFVVIEVSDTGKGISKSNFESVFKPGFTTKERGWGLGLSLARRIIEQYHKGRIFVKSSVVGSGTTFRIELPKNG